MIVYWTSPQPLLTGCFAISYRRGVRFYENKKPSCSFVCLVVKNYSFNKKSPLFSKPSNIASIAFEFSGDNSSNSNDFNLVCVVRTDGSRKFPNGNDVRNNW